jgi:hypothetical protein
MFYNNDYENNISEFIQIKKQVICMYLTMMNMIITV